MFKFFKEKIKMLFNKRENIIEDQIDDREVLTIKINDNIEIEIKEDCTLSEYSKNLGKYENIRDIFIPMKIFFTNIPGSYSTTSKIIKQKIYIIEKDNLKYFISINYDKVKILQYKKEESNILETGIEINRQSKGFCITQSILDLNYSSRETKWYVNNDEYKRFSLEKLEATVIMSEMLANLWNIKDIDNIIDIEGLYIFLNNKLQFKSYSIISDEAITLSTYIDNINDKKCHTFDIILNDTNDKIGFIKFDYNSDIESEDSYGNIFYGIYGKYQHNGYATRALKLLKKLIIDSKIDCNKDMYFWVGYYNEASKRVIVNNGGEIIKKGSPITDDGPAKPYILKIKT